MRKKTIYFLAFLSISIIAFCITACTKKAEEINSSINQLQQISVSILKSEIKEWQKAISLDNRIDLDIRKKYSKIEDEIDYSKSITVNKLDGATTLIYSLVSGKGLNKYLFLSKKGNAYESQLLYKTTMNTKDLNSFLSSSSMRNGDKVESWNLQDQPIKGWELTKEGRRVYKLLKKKIISNTNLNNVVLQSSSGNNLKVSKIDDPEAGVCIEWYWIVYDEDTNEILYEEYMFSTGNCGTGGNTSTASPNSTTCNFTEEEADEILEGGQPLFVNEVSMVGDGSAIQQQDGKIRGNAIPKWKFGGMRFGIGSTSYFTTYSGYAYYSGKRYRNNANDQVWKYESLTLSSSAIEEETNIICLDVNLEITSHSETISGDEKTCAVAVNFKMQGVITCLVGVKFGNPYIGSNDVVLEASKDY